VGQAEFPETVSLVFGTEGLGGGYDVGEAVSHGYHAPFRFTGAVASVTVGVSGTLIKDTEAEVRALLARQ
jgi:arylsulfatase